MIGSLLVAAYSSAAATDTADMSSGSSDSELDDNQLIKSEVSNEARTYRPPKYWDCDKGSLRLVMKHVPTVPLNTGTVTKGV